jgi:hypothetical protein
MSHGATRALAHCGRIRDLILHHGGGWADADTLRKFRRLSYSASCAADDAQCTELMRLADEYAVDLFSESAHLKWGRARTSGADILRLCILAKLDAFRARLEKLSAELLALGRVAAVDRDRSAGHEVGRPAAEEDGDPG